MKSLGMYMALAGIFSGVLSLVGYNLKLLMWIDMWGETTGWLIRGGLVLVGAAIFFLLPAEEDEAEVHVEKKVGEL